MQMMDWLSAPFRSVLCRNTMSISDIVSWLPRPQRVISKTQNATSYASPIQRTRSVSTVTIPPTTILSHPFSHFPIVPNLLEGQAITTHSPVGTARPIAHPLESLLITLCKYLFHFQRGNGPNTASPSSDSC